MGEPYSRINQKLEKAICELIKLEKGPHLDVIPDEQVRTGFQTSGAAAANRILVSSRRAVPQMVEDIWTGNYECDVEITLVTNYGDYSDDERELMSSELFDMILRRSPAELIDLLNGIPEVEDFTIYNGDEGQGMGIDMEAIERDAEDHSIIETLKGKVYCRPSASIR